VESTSLDMLTAANLVTVGRCKTNAWYVHTNALDCSRSHACTFRGVMLLALVSGMLNAWSLLSRCSDLIVQIKHARFIDSLWN
jgi:hypothetical protein